MRDPILFVPMTVPQGGTEASVKVKLSVSGVQYTLDLTYQQGSHFHAGLLQKALFVALTDRIRAVREEEYERGYSDGRRRRAKRTPTGCTLFLWEDADA